MKPLVLLSFSLTFLTQGFADDALAAEPSNQVSAEEHDGNQVMTNDSFAAEPSEQVRDDNLSNEEQPYAPMSMQSEDSLSEWCLSPYHEMHASIRHNEARGIGYKDGYTTLEAFGIYDGWGSGLMPFVDIRGHVFNDGKWAGNLGIGERTLFTSINHTLGSYLYYDVRRVGHDLTVNQLSPGIELVGERMEYRINGYFPLGKQKGHQYGFKFDKFKGHSIILKAKQQQAMMGFDAEVGAHIPQNTMYDVYAAAGPYYFRSSNAHSWGGRARVLGRYKEYVSLEVAYSYDSLFRSVVQGSVAFTLPFGRKLQRCGQCCPQTDNLLLSRAAFAPSRFEIPVVKKVHKLEKAINPVTGDPWIVWFVNNTSHSAGTFESPFPTLLQAQNASSPTNMIYVFSGDGTTTGMNAGITLKDWQTFFGSGTKQQFSTTKGTMTIPAFSNTMPMIAGGVTIGSGNVVSGFNVTTGIIGNLVATNLNSLTVANNVIANGIFFQGTGNVNIYNNRISGAAGSGMNVAGIAILAAPGGLITGQVYNNILIGAPQVLTPGIYLENVVPTTPGRFDFIVANNLVEQYTDGIVARVLGTNSLLTVTGNTIINTNINSANIGIGLAALVAGRTGQQGKMIVSNNTVIWAEPTSDPAIAVVDTAAVPSPLFQEKIIIQNNMVDLRRAAGTAGIVAATFNKYCVTMDNNTVMNSPSISSPSFSFITQGNGIINVDSLENNVGLFFETTGNVFFVPPGTCGN